MSCHTGSFTSEMMLNHDIALTAINQLSLIEVAGTRELQWVHKTVIRKIFL